MIKSDHPLFLPGVFAVCATILGVKGKIKKDKQFAIETLNKEFGIE